MKKMFQGIPSGAVILADNERKKYVHMSYNYWPFKYSASLKLIF